MRAKLRKIGNSKGIQIPKAIIDEIGLGTEVELTVENRRLIVSPVSGARNGWDEAFKELVPVVEQDIVNTIENEFDREEWAW